MIDDGAFHNLTALQHLDCSNNRHLNTIHPNAFAKSNNDSQTQWPPIRSVGSVSFSSSLFIFFEKKKIQPKILCHLIGWGGGRL